VVYSTVCKKCLTFASFSVVLNYGIYSDVLAEAINLMKFSGLRRFASPLGQLLLTLEMPECDGIIPVPLSKNALRERGFNQSLLMAKVISKNLRIPVHMERSKNKRHLLLKSAKRKREMKISEAL
jgi:predicted amidophosphoribosyltransferase